MKRFKVCSMCEHRKPIAEFTEDNGVTKWVSGYCKQCRDSIDNPKKQDEQKCVKSNTSS